MAQARRFQQGLSQPASKFLDDLNTEIEQGWTGHGQTNRLLGRIAMRSYIFGHLLNGLSAPLEGAQLVNDIVRVACQLPGYREWCCHQHEIEDRAEEWARCAENSHYFPYGHSKNQIAFARLSDQSPTEISWNQKQESDARSRIARAVAKLFEGNRFPTSTTARFHLLVQEGIGGGTLYRHRDLWHPTYLQQQLATDDSISSEIKEENFEHQNFDFPTAMKAGSQSENDYDPALKSLLEADGRNLRFLESSSDLEHQLLEPGCNFYDDCLHVSGSVPVVEQTTLIQKQRSQWQEAYRDRMQRYLVSGDAILMAEAQAWFAQFDASESLSDADRAPKKAEDIQTDLPLVTKPSGELSRVKTVEPLEKIPIQKNQTNCLDRPITHQEQFQGVVQAIAYHLARLNWTAPTLRHHLLVCTGKPLQALLNDVELVRWLQFLESA
ncbi:hypothetical protein [Vacuolonema iberomarrocanum]|uniref:hypothetical protein n=1 Tax=Vacuolonema iberomarrocanum TaxID=3454632 RepID=UPI0019E5302E|nr:hypothetical protein [filamentous cyanobacterium LEGE 07170]